MSAPQRVQLSRKKGSRMPPNTVPVAGPSQRDNIVKVGAQALIEAIDGNQYSFVVTPAIAKAVYAAHMSEMLKSRPWLRDALNTERRGKNLACWCALDEPCHADVLLELTNRQEST
ncbi:MAG TPA: DUF4326 domain-containing protein [Burkholderiales bacterium]|nr:DUF4326 domain-containing protein [Burkholderiales bacterium]